VLKILAIFVLLTSYTHAKNITIINNGSPTGINSQLLTEYIKEYSEYEITLKHTNQNCALSKMLWDSSSKNPTFFILLTNVDGSSDKANKLCYTELLISNILFINYSAPMEFCSTSAKSWKDFTRAGSIHTIGTTSTTTRKAEIFLETLSKIYKTELKLVRTQNNSDFMTLVKAGELDFGFRTGLKGLSDFTDRCFWDVNDAEIRKITSDKDLYNSLYEDSFILHKNLTSQQIIDFRNRFHKSWKSDSSKKLRARRGYDDNLVSYESEEDRVMLYDKFIERY
jgi:hypothetical protein